jgi:hypothetical protein
VKTQTRQCLIPIRLGKCEARALLDSGSTISAINGNLFQKSEFASLPLKTPRVAYIIGTGGATYPIQGQINLQFSIGGLLLSQTFYVISALRHSMILGRYFFQRNEACFDWQNNTLSLRQILLVSISSTFHKDLLEFQKLLIFLLIQFKT